MLSCGAMTVAVSLALGWTVPAQQMSLPSSASMWACLVGQAVLLTGAQLGFIRSTQELPAYVGSVLQVTDIFWGYMLHAAVTSEIPDLLGLLGAALVFVSVLVSIYGKQPDARASSTTDTRYDVRMISRDSIALP